MKKIFSVIIATVLFCAYGHADQAVTVNPGGNATQGHFPVYGENADTKSNPNTSIGVQTIYLADQLKGIAAGSEIKALTFYSSKQTQNWGKAEFKVSLAKTDDTFFQNAKGAYATASTGSALTEVYEGPLSVADGELTVNFTEPYAYEGGNLLIQVEITREGTYSASSFYSATTTAYLIKYAYSGSSRETKQPKVTFVIAGGDTDPVSETCKAPTAVTVEKVTEATATVSWQGEASQYQYCLEFEGDMPDWTAAKLTDQKSVTVTGLYDEQKYYFYVRSYCSETAVSETVKATFKTACARLNVPWIETFTRDASGSETVGDIAPVCWTISSAAPAVTIVAEKEDDGSGNQIATGEQHLTARGGGATSAQVFAMPLFNAQLDTCELAFDYCTSVISADYGVLEIGYMTNPADAATFVSLKTLEQTITDDYKHVVFPLNDLPAGIEYIAFRFAGGTSNFGSASMDNFVLAGIGHSGEVDPSQEELADANIYALTYCQAQFMWYSYNASAFAIALFDADAQAMVAGTVATTEECNRFAYQDMESGEFGGFSAGDDSDNHYYCSTKWILNVDEAGLQKGDSWSKCVINVGSMLGLAPGKYQIQVYELVQTGESSYEKGELLATIPFELVAKYVTGLKAVVAEDKKTTTLTWEAPEFGAGERLYVRVWSGETVAYDNFNTNDRPASPLTVEVVEGKSYTAIVQVVDRYNNALGQEMETNFTVGVNNYEPANPHAEVAGGDNVTFTWEAVAAADRYVITLYCDGEFYSTLTVNGTTKTTTMPKDGTWSWTVQAFNQGANGNYFEASNAIAGNDFVTKAAEIPADAVELDVIGLNAYYIEPNTEWYQEGKNGWILQFGVDNAGYQFAWFLVYTNSAAALSGNYNLTRQNLDSESDLIYLSDGTVQGTESEVRLQFDGYDEVEVSSGYSLTQAFYTGSFRLVGDDGKTYVGRFMELMCSSGDFTNYASGNPSNHITLYDEDPSYFAGQGIETIATPSKDAQKVLRDGQLLILRDGKTYNVLGTAIK
ncbi:MAG: fibronectin type III domain-containing protein [Paludibacteraceae bacterium]|nr:fibronectin type III domain-containing protein [Paludibacteraceae bacterium]